MKKLTDILYASYRHPKQSEVLFFPESFRENRINPDYFLRFRKVRRSHHLRWQRFSLRPQKDIKKKSSYTALNSRAFTMIELLLGLVIFSVIALVIYNLFSSGVKLSQRFDSQNEIYKEIRWTFEGMAKEIENMLPYDFASSYSEKFALTGTAHKITFLNAPKDQLAFIEYELIEPGFAHISQTIIGKTIAKNKAETQFRTDYVPVHFLVRREKGFAEYLNGGFDKNKDEEILAANVKAGSLTFRYGYFDAKDGDKSQEMKWKDEWKENKFPAMIRVSMDFVVYDKQHKNAPSQTISFTQDVLIFRGMIHKEKEANSP
jgi:prepilin-type N-terminal cleavage/methylation domain-containing protein